jgi:hypothetical protein
MVASFLNDWSWLDDRNWSETQTKTARQSGFNDRERLG